jgi:hypothetical protein
MDPNALFRRNVRSFYYYLGALLTAGAAPIVASRLVEAGSVASRVAAVAVGVLGWIPLLVFTATAIRRGDEFSRRIHLVAIALAFAAALLLISLCDWLAKADFVPPLRLDILWLAIAVTWVVSLIATKRHYER